MMKPHLLIHEDVRTLPVIHDDLDHDDEFGGDPLVRLCEVVAGLCG